MTPAAVVDAIADGARLGMQFNPVFATVGAAVAAAVVGYPKAHDERRFSAGVVIAIAWLAGDGLRVIARARDAADGIGALHGAALGWLTLLAWGITGLALGYIAPMLAGAAVGRRVTFGTGWLTSATISVAVSLALASILAALPIR
ncbi:MAG: hypothetical protein ABFC80_06355 [Coriobacteriales bacterium]|nr:hypothetical protein [Actinomycetes bacterium]